MYAFHRTQVHGTNVSSKPPMLSVVGPIAYKGDHGLIRLHANKVIEGCNMIFGPNFLGYIICSRMSIEYFLYGNNTLSFLKCTTYKLCHNPKIILISTETTGKNMETLVPNYDH
jgi:hypothetical protein